MAVWDIDDVFPSLGKTLAAMNEAQSVFGFELADMSAPLDVWDLNNGTSYLWAESVANRLKSKAAEIGADVLACVTRHWLRDDDYLNIYGWWPEAQKPPVVIFSLAGFEQLKAEGPETDRAIANAVVASLTGFYANLNSHARGPKDCPMWFDERRDYKHLAGRLKFDATCRRRLASLGAKLGGLDALLRVFTSGDE